VALALSYFACGSFQRVAGYLSGAKLSCSNKAIHDVISACGELFKDLISLPTEEEMAASAHYFQEKYNLPGFCLGVDGMLVRLGLKPSESHLPPGLVSQDYWCRKQFYALNVLVAADHKKLIRNIVTVFAGSWHDARVFRNSSLKPFMDSQRRFLLAADSAYLISRNVMKPYPEKQSGRAEKKFNQMLSGIRTESTENVYAMMKQIFPALRMGLRMKPSACSKAVIGMAVFHNLSILLNDPVPEDDHPLMDPFSDSEDEDQGQEQRG
jgi:hypothetical protein